MSRSFFRSPPFCGSWWRNGACEFGSGEFVVGGVRELSRSVLREQEVGIVQDCGNCNGRAVVWREESGGGTRRLRVCIEVEQQAV